MRRDAGGPCVSAWRRLGAVAALAAVAACRGDSDGGGGGAPPTLPDGQYDLTPVVCLTTSKPPAFPAANFKVVFGSFDELTSAALSIAGSSARYVYTDADCKLTLDRVVHRNDGGVFSLKLARTHAWEPDGCLLTVTVNGVRNEVGKGYGDLFADGKDFREEVPFDVEVAGTSYKLVSDDREDLDKLWASYGCATADRIVTTYNLKQ